MKNLYIVRHGQSHFNRLGRMQGCNDESRLTEAGQTAAIMVGKSLSGMKFDRVLMSPLARARDTLELILLESADNSAQPEIVSDLRETNMYGWEGQLMAELAKAYPQQWHDWMHQPEALKLQHLGKDVYPMRDLYARAQTFLEQEIYPDSTDGKASSADSHILLVSHGGTNQALINRIIGLDVTHHQTFQQSNCGINHLVIKHASPDEPASGKLIQLNNTLPLGENLPKLKARKKGLRAIFLIHDHDHAQDRANVQTLTANLNIDSVIEWQQHGAGNFMGNFMDNLINRRAETDLHRAAADESTLHTVLILCHPRGLCTALKRLFALEESLLQKIKFERNKLTVIHHSNSHPKPIIQCINLPIRLANIDRFGQA